MTLLWLLDWLIQTNEGKVDINGAPDERYVFPLPKSPAANVVLRESEDVLKMVLSRIGTRL